MTTFILTLPQAPDAKCPQCGTSLGTGTLTDLCPKCLLNTGLKEDTDMTAAESPIQKNQKNDTVGEIGKSQVSDAPAKPEV
jgi:hypothetical protein